MVWPVWVIQAIIFVATTIISIALAPKPRNAKSATLADFEVPTAEEGRSIPVVFGTVMITGPNVTWYGDLDKVAVRKSSMGSSTVVGFKYYLGLHYSLCFGPIDEFKRWDWDEMAAWSGSLAASGTQSINLPRLFGGGKSEGGLVGDFDLLMGEQTQAPNGYLLAQIGAPLSAYRGVVSVVWKGGYIGRSKYIKPCQFLVRRTAAGWEQGSAWNPADVTVDGGMNPAHMVYEILTNSNFGYGEPGAAIDETTFGAVADTFVSENFGLNLQWVQSDEIGEFLGEVCSHAGMVLGEDPTTGKYTLTALRDDYVAEDLDLIDENSVIELIRYSRPGWGETVNEITINYTDPVSNKQTGVTVHDLGNIRAQGRVIAQTIKYPGIRNHDVAKTVAARELVQRSTPLGRGTIRCSRRAWRHQQGGVVRFSWEKEGMVDVPHRVMAIRKGTLEDGSIEIDLAEDVFGISTATYVDASSIDDIPTPPGDPGGTETASGGSVLSTTTTAPPGSPADGDSYYVPTGATGDWAGHAGEVATWDAEEAAWLFEVVSGAPIVHVDDDDDYVVLDGAGGTDVAPWSTITVLAWKDPVRVATTAAGTLATSFENGDTIDGVVLATGDRILIKNQASGTENGIYVVAASGAPTRATDTDSATEMLGATVFVSEGSSNADKQFSCTTNAPITIGATSLAFAQVGGVGGLLTDGDYGDITVSGGGTAMAIDNDAVTYAKMQDVGATARVLGRKTAGAGNTEECTLSEVLDFIGSAAQGDILYRGAATWSRLAAGTSGHVLKTGGAGANPSWVPVGAVAGGTYGLYCTSDVTRDNSGTGDTLTDDPVMVATLEANKKYAFIMHLVCEINASPDFKYDFNFTGTNTYFSHSMFYMLNLAGTYGYNATGTNIGSYIDNALNNPLVFASGSGGTMLVFAKAHGGIEVGASGGTFSFRWAQNLANANPTIRKKGSWMQITEVP